MTEIRVTASNGAVSNIEYDTSEGADEASLEEITNQLGGTLPTFKSNTFASGATWSNATSKWTGTGG